MVDDKDGYFCYRIKSSFSDVDEFTEVEKEYWKKNHNDNIKSRILKILIDGRNTSNTLVRYLIEEGKKLLNKHKYREVLIIIFNLDSYDDDELKILEKTVNPCEYLTRLLKISPDYAYDSCNSYLALKNSVY
ncbi:MAG: hypothetical protein EAX96_01845 [Candidatus Lokiarchaeota archaeon]|nr:hypothetical protein [Candidatus Lokiarchaeota archaeon]